MANPDDIVLFAKPRQKKQKAKKTGQADGGVRDAPPGAQPETQQPASAQLPAPAAGDGVREGLTESYGAGPGPGSTGEARRQPQPLPDGLTSFKALGLTDWLSSVCQSLGMSRPTQVQQGCIPAILQGKDVIGLAQTGSGKTAAFALPILQLLSRDPFGVYALVLTPTR